MTARRRGSSSRLWFILHGWLGFKLSLLMVFICLTGTVATLSNEIDWLVKPALRVAPAGGGVDWDAVQDGVEKAYPEAAIRRLRAPLGPRFAAEVWIAVPDWTEGGFANRIVYVHPHTGAVQGDSSRLTVQRFLRDLHMWLFSEKLWGLLVVSFFGFVLLGSLITGLVVYKKFWRGFFRLRIDKGARVFWGDLHKLTGLWSAWFVLVIAGTSIWYFAEIAMIYLRYDPFESVRPAVGEAALERYGPTPNRLGVGAYAAIAKRAFPDLRIAEILLPAGLADPALVLGQGPAWLVRDRANRVAIDPFDGRVLDVQRAEEMTAGRRWVDTADPLHFGDFGGLTTKLIWFFFGLVLSGMILTGGWLTLRRGYRLAGTDAAPAGAAEAPTPSRGGPRLRWRWRYLNIGVLALAVVYTVDGVRGYRVAPPAPAVVLDEQVLGPWRVVLAFDHPLAAGQRAAYRLRFDCGGCAPNFRKGLLAIRSSNGTRVAGADIAGGSAWQVGAIALPSSTGPNLTLSLEIESWDGGVHRAEWLLPKIWPSAL